MDARDEFEFWQGEYLENPNMSDKEVLRLLLSLCTQGNPYAIDFAEAELSLVSAELRGAAEWLSYEPPSGYIDDLDEYTNLDDLDGLEHAILAGVTPPGVSTTPHEFVVLGDAEGGYPPTWPQIAKGEKDRRGWRCERCGFQRFLSSLIQVHHIDHDKQNSEPENLMVVCAVCHGALHGGSPTWPSGVPEREVSDLRSHHRRQALARLKDRLALRRG